MRNKIHGNKVRKVFSAEQWGVGVGGRTGGRAGGIEDKLQCRKLLGYVCILKIYCICAVCPNVEEQPGQER